MAWKSDLQLDQHCSAQSVLLDQQCPVNLGTRHTTLNKANQKLVQSVWTPLESWWWISQTAIATSTCNTALWSNQG